MTVYVDPVTCKITKKIRQYHACGGGYGSRKRAEFCYDCPVNVALNFERNQYGFLGTSNNNY